MSERIIMISRPASPEEKEVIERKGGLRLNQAMKQSIVKKAMSHAFDARFKALIKERQELGHKAMVAAFGHARLKAAKTAGVPFVAISTNHYGEKLDDGTPANWRVGHKTISLLHLDPLPTNLGHRSEAFFAVKDEALKEAIFDMADRGDILSKESAKTQHTLEAMLQNIQAFSTLERTWPEGKKFYKHIPVDFPFRHQVPATLVADLNKSLGI